jgi:CheY-like chemotaxis protein
MTTHEMFVQELHKALAHLYDPDYRPSETLCTLLDLDPQDGALAVQSAIVDAVKALEPLPDTPVTAQTRRVHNLLHGRYVLKLSQEEVAERLHMSRRSVQRAQAEAVHTLAMILWRGGAARNRLPHHRPEEKGELSSEESAPDAQAQDWHAQAGRELAALYARAPGVVSSVEEVIDDVLALELALMSERGVRVQVGSVQTGMVAEVHPAVLRQTLITAMELLARHTSNRRITLFARLEGGSVKITMATAVAAENTLLEADLNSAILTAENMSVDTHVDGGRAFLWIGIPYGGGVTVLVVDDNPEIAHFYRSATKGTRYHIAHTTQGQDLFETIETTTPDIIVLDIMLPDVDGWKLLTHLHQNPATRSIPVVVCSVIRAEELALSLGAALYLPKPVRFHQFIQALDQVLLQASEEASIAEANNEAAS